MWPKRDKRGATEAQEALAQAEESLDKIQQREPEVQGVVEGFLELSRENNFARNLREIMIVRQGKRA